MLANVPIQRKSRLNILPRQIRKSSDRCHRSQIQRCSMWKWCRSRFVKTMPESCVLPINCVRAYRTHAGLLVTDYDGERRGEVCPRQNESYLYPWCKHFDASDPGKERQRKKTNEKFGQQESVRLLALEAASWIYVRCRFLRLPSPVHTDNSPAYHPHCRARTRASYEIK